MGTRQLTTQGLRVFLRYLKAPARRLEGMPVRHFGIYPPSGRGKLNESASHAIVSEARAHLSETLSRQSKLPEYGSRWQPQVELMGRDISSLTDFDACLRYAQYNISFDGRPPFPGDTGIVQMREWARRQRIPATCWRTLADVRKSKVRGGESLGEFNGRLVSLVMYYHARNVLAATYCKQAAAHRGNWRRLRRDRAHVAQKSNSVARILRYRRHSGMPSSPKSP